ncbi:MAG: hypothetical protein HY727_10175 [Candidatus Rokubacteria bacterium]|nr:hypothetical protein [Candidatus Rokubacteria bacterium]
MTGEQRRHRAAVLLILASVLWLHRWVPALLVAALVSWVILHKRLEGDLGDALARLWRRAWPPGARVLVPLLSATTLAYWVSDVPITPKVLPIALNMLALSLILLGHWWTLLAPREQSWTAGTTPSPGAESNAALPRRTGGG